ncbi:MAG: hypothetical protein F4077_00020 [Gammaproteobacteria bacterium]|nr:hypothetical protein [Gammaproteobacteria bacterium]MYI76145.1 hypothetical protein [Gammaproteobacteria bacterium]
MLFCPTLPEEEIEDYRRALNIELISSPLVISNDKTRAYSRGNDATTQQNNSNQNKVQVKRNS